MDEAKSSGERGLVERLREQGRWVVTKSVPLIPQMDEEEWVPDALCAQAADEIERLREAIQDAERAILGDGTVEADLRLHEALAPLWAALSGSREATDG